MSVVNEILLRRKSMVLLENIYEASVPTNTEKALVLSAIKNIESLGYTVSKELFDLMLTLNREDFTKLYKDLIKQLKVLVGADVKYNPMYPNFPEQVMEASDMELYINAIIHYFTYGLYLPEYEKEERLPLFDSNKMVVLTVGNKEDLMQVFSNLVSSKTSLSQQDKDDVAAIISTVADYSRYLPDEILLKENVALIGKLVIEKAPIKSASAIQKYFNTATDVLRFVTALSDGDISLAKNTKYRKLRRVERRMVMDLLAGCGNIIEDLFRYQYQWIRVGEIVHPGEFKGAKYDLVRESFNVLRANDKPLMFAGKVHEYINSLNMKEAANLLKKRPGEFARQLDKVLRDATDKNYVINCFKSIAVEVSPTVLLQVRQHFMTRNNGDKYRVFFPKGNVARSIIIPNEITSIEERYCKAVVTICENALSEIYKSKDFLGKVYIDSELKNYIVPFSQRSANSSSKIVVRGSKLPINEDAKALRGFIWWTNTEDNQRVDIDLSAAFFDEDWRYINHVSYTNLRSEKLASYHSGDITDGGLPNGEGVAEFLDVDLDKAKSSARYLVYQVYSFNCQKFNTLPNCRFGFMEREDVKSGEIFEPKTVSMKMDVTSASTVSIPVIIDLVERKAIWCDMNIGIESLRRGYANNFETNVNGVKEICKSIVNMNKPNIYDLALLNANARGIVVQDRNDADIIFSNDTTSPVEVVTSLKNGVETIEEITKTDVPIVTAFDVDYFMGQLL